MRSRLASLIVSLALLAAPSPGAGSQKYPAKYIKGSSDWWSILNENFRTPLSNPEKRSFASSNLEIAGQSFRDADLFDVGDDPFGRITSALGTTRVTERGGASTSRSQLCYTSAAHPGATYLVFESGESELTFYLFFDGTPWKGTDSCTRSPLVSRLLATGSGLHLGMTTSQVLSILGHPTVSFRGRLIYWGTTLRETPVDVLNKLRQQNPKMSSADFRDDFSQYDLTIYIEVRFSAGRMIYLAVSENTT